MLNQCRISPWKDNSYDNGRYNDEKECIKVVQVNGIMPISTWIPQNMLFAKCDHLKVDKKCSEK